MLRLGLIPSVDPDTMISEAQPFLHALQSLTGEAAEAVVPPSYDAVARGLLDGSIDIGFIGPAGYVVAKDKLKAPIMPIARGVLDVGGSSWGSAIIVARSDAGIDTVGDLQGRSFLFSDPVSTSGYFIPYSVLAQNGVSPEAGLGSSRFTGSLGASLEQVATGVADAAGIGDEILALAVKRGELRDSDVKTIYTSKPIPGSLFVMRTSLGEDLKEQLKRGILKMQDMPFCKIGLIRSMDVAADEEYDLVRDHLREFERHFFRFAAGSALIALSQSHC